MDFTGLLTLSIKKNGLFIILYISLYFKYISSI